MFWAGEILALLAGLIGIAFVRRTMANWIPRVADLHLDVAAFLLLMLGLAIGAIVHVQEVAESDKLSHDLEAVRDFSEAASLTPQGTHGLAGAGLKEVTPLSQLLDGAWIQQEGRLYPSCDSVSLEKFRTAIDSYPRFPFSYYALAICLHSRSVSAWKQYAERAIDIFEKTTKVAGHQPSHEQALAQLREYLEP
jgi:hypothetical protein